MKRFRPVFLVVFAGISIAANGQSFAQTDPRPVSVPPPLAVAAPVPSLDDFLKWDAIQKDVTVPFGTADAKFTFTLTNVSSEVVVINSAVTSCGCTVAQLPETPWKLAPGKTGEISATMTLAGKSGSIVKTITVSTDKGVKTLMVHSIISAAPPVGQMTANDREMNQKLALADRQAVFKNDCARCHVEPTKGKLGKELFAAACGICHEAPHRASMVADLRALPYVPTADVWKNWIVHGKPGTLMPAFAKSQDGILTDEQVDSLVKYLVNEFPAKRTAQTAPPSTGTH